MPTTPTDTLPAPSGPGVASLLPLLQLADSGAPTGAFSHSFGLETAMAEGRVVDADTCAEWMAAYVSGCLARADVLAIRLVHEDSITLREADLVLATSLVPAEARAGTRTIGRRMLTIARDRFPGPHLLVYDALVSTADADGHPALVLAMCGLDRGLGWRDVALVQLLSTVTCLVQVAVRAVPLGQNAGQAVLAGLHPVLTDAVDVAAAADPGDLGAAAPLIEIDQLVHSTMRARMFMS